jgi:hypothetical protein
MAVERYDERCIFNPPQSFGRQPKIRNLEYKNYHTVYEAHFQSDPRHNTVYYFT